MLIHYQLNLFQKMKTKKAIFASGCFWGTEYYMSKAKGVIKATSGYAGGQTENPTYEQVSSGKTGHVEAVEVLYNPDVTNYETLAKLFFETHDPAQKDGQGPDIGSQYRSKIFYNNEDEKLIAENLISILKKQALDVATKIEEAGPFYPAEDYHQKHYDKTGGSPYCHIYRKLF